MKIKNQTKKESKAKQKKEKLRNQWKRESQ